MASSPPPHPPPPPSQCASIHRPSQLQTPPSLAPPDAPYICCCCVCRPASTQPVHYALSHCALGLCQEKLNSSGKKKKMINIVLLHYTFKNTCKLDPLTRPLHLQTCTRLFFFPRLFETCSPTALLTANRLETALLDLQPMRARQQYRTFNTTDFGKAGTSHRSPGRDRRGIGWLRPPVRLSPVRTSPVADIATELSRLSLWLFSIALVVWYIVSSSEWHILPCKTFLFVPSVRLFHHAFESHV